MRRIEADPSSVGRIVGGIALMIALVGVVQAGLIAVERADRISYLAEWTRSLSPDTVIASAWTYDAQRASPYLEVPGVRAAEVTRRLPGGGINGRPVTAIVRTDGRPETLEALRTRFALTADIVTIGALRAQESSYGSEYRELGRGLSVITLFLLLVNGATLTVAMVDWTMERRRALAVLSATGVPAGVLRRSVLAQVSMPLATSVAFGFIGAIVVIVLLFETTDTPLVLPVRELVELSIAAAAVVVAVTALTMPWVRAARRPELLRNE